ncbi:unnamed protein product [Haemonchus placei]|uniref:SCP domain-containing protein n=1 Tax=Haemonchus placei TaxID=6290 RepID=A0A0N4WGF2_HAEPC|nr:unnamed protein product [Haemonchus placei]
MLFIFTVLAFFLANVASSDLSRSTFSALPDDVLSAFEELNSYGGKLVWSDELAEKALKHLKSPDSEKADLVIGEEITLPEDDSSPLGMGMKIYSAFSELFETKGSEISNLPDGSKYGCNYENSVENKGAVLKIVCLYNKNSH